MMKIMPVCIYNDVVDICPLYGMATNRKWFCSEYLQIKSNNVIQFYSITGYLYAFSGN